jgi:chitin disaccharide deacetylase
MIICADDYGMRADIDRAILQLCETEKLTAVSCMVLFERCDAAAMQKIRAHENRTDLGLHFCLTNENLPLSAPLEKTVLPEFGKLFRRALLRTLQREEILFLLSAQYDLFLNKAGRAPDYIDGHLHSHQLPVVAEALVEFVSKLTKNERPCVRNTRLDTKILRNKNLPALKAGFIGAFGARLEKKMRAAEIPTNDGFSGIYDFKDWKNYAEFFPKFLECLPEKNGILVTHPGFDEDWRRSEFETLGKFSGGANRFQR